MKKFNITVKFNGKDYVRAISISLSAQGATGNVFNGEAKTGFYRWNKGFKYPMFFATNKTVVKGPDPLNLAIAEVVKTYCDELRTGKGDNRPAESEAQVDSSSADDYIPEEAEGEW